MVEWNLHFSVAKMKTVYQFKTKPSNNPFAPEFNYVLLEGQCFTEDECLDIKQFMLHQEKYLLEKLKNHPSVDGNTGLGEDSITAKFPHFSVFDFKHPMVNKIKSSIIEHFNDILNITNNTWNAHLYAQSWFNVMRPKQKINFHMHGVNEDILYGFHITVSTENTSTIYHNPFDHRQTIDISNKVGYITLFPNFIPHQTTVYNGSDVRISIAGDIVDSLSLAKKEYGIYREIGFL